MKPKLRKNSKYFVANPRDLEFGKRIPMTCRYVGLFPEGHLFTCLGDDFSGYWIPENELTKLVEPFSKEREAQVNRAAEKYLAKA
jgi:hypothetical protein